MAGIRLSALAQADIVALLAWTADRFGPLAQERYEALLSAALAALVENPGRTGTAARPELGDAVRTYHLRHMKKRPS
jgi:toxin ParE1/3/4